MLFCSFGCFCALSSSSAPPKLCAAAVLDIASISATSSALCSSDIGHTGGGLIGGGRVLSSSNTGGASFGDGCITSCSGIGGSGSLLCRICSLGAFLSVL